MATNNPHQPPFFVESRSLGEHEMSQALPKPALLKALHAEAEEGDAPEASDGALDVRHLPSTQRQPEFFECYNALP